MGGNYVIGHRTLARSRGEKPPPPLKQIPAGEPGSGQYLLPLGRNQTTVDPDLINNINSLPYAQRFRLIFNELGAGLAGRGQDLEAAIKKANPTLRSVDKIFGELTEQKDQLAQLAAESQEILEPLTEEKEHVVGFLAHSGEASEASAEHGAELEESLQKFPTFLVEFRQTMSNLKQFSDAGTPLLEQLGVAAPSLTDATRTLTPFSEATTVALKSLGKAGEESGPVFAEAEPVVRKAAKLAKSGEVSTEELAKLFISLKKTGGWDGLTELIYNTAAATNGFDKYGHFGRTLLVLSTCVEYEDEEAGYSGCVANFNGPQASSEPTSERALINLMNERDEEFEEGKPGTGEKAAERETTPAGLGEARSTETPTRTARGTGEGVTGLGATDSATGGTEPLLDYLMGQEEE